MTASARPSSTSYVVDEPAVSRDRDRDPGGHPRCRGAPFRFPRAHGTERPDSDLDLLVTVPDEWLATHSRFEETGDLGWMLAHHRIPIDLLLYSHQEAQDRLQHRQHVVVEAYRHGRELHAC